MVFTPIALLWVGIGTWTHWSGEAFGWQLGLAMVVLRGLSMQMSVQSDVSYLQHLSHHFITLLPWSTNWGSTKRSSMKANNSLRSAC